MSSTPAIRRRGKTPKSCDDAKRATACARFLNGEFDDWPEERDWAVLFLRSVRSATTIGTYASNLIQMFRWCREVGARPFELRKPVVKGYEAGLSHLRECTRNARCVAPRSFFNFVLDDEAPPISSNPFRGVGPTKPTPADPTPALEQAQFDELIDYLLAERERAPSKLVRHRDVAMIYLMGRVGPRRITTSHLRWGDVQQDRGQVLLRMHLKGNRYERIELPGDVVAVLAAWWQKLADALGRPPAEDDALFPPLGPMAISLPGGPGLEPLGAAGISWIVTERLKAIGITGKGWSAHAMRASAATIADENGAPLEVIQAMLCHLNREQTAGYLRRARPKPSAARYWTPRVVQASAIGGGGDAATPPFAASSLDQAA